MIYFDRPASRSIEFGSDWTREEKVESDKYKFVLAAGQTTMDFLRSTRYFSMSSGGQLESLRQDNFNPGKWQFWKVPAAEDNRRPFLPGRRSGPPLMAGRPVVSSRAPCFAPANQSRFRRSLANGFFGNKLHALRSRKFHFAPIFDWPANLSSFVKV